MSVLWNSTVQHKLMNMCYVALIHIKVVMELLVIEIWSGASVWSSTDDHWLLVLLCEMTGLCLNSFARYLDQLPTITLRSFFAEGYLPAFYGRSLSLLSVGVFDKVILNWHMFFVQPVIWHCFYLPTTITMVIFFTQDFVLR